MKVAQSCPTLCDPMDCSSWNSPSQNTGVSSLFLLKGIFPTQGLNPSLPHCRWILYQLSHKESPRILGWVAYSFSSRFSRPRDQTGVSCTASRFFTNWAIREDLKSKYKSLIGKETHLNLFVKNSISRILWREKSNPVLFYFSPFLTKSIYPTKFNSVLENPDHV